MALETIAFETKDEDGKPVFSSIQEAADKVKELVGDSEYLGHIAIEASVYRQGPGIMGMTATEGYVLLVDTDTSSS